MNDMKHLYSGVVDIILKEWSLLFICYFHSVNFLSSDYCTKMSWSSCSVVVQIIIFSFFFFFSSWGHLKFKHFGIRRIYIYMNCILPFLIYIYIKTLEELEFCKSKNESISPRHENVITFFTQNLHKMKTLNKKTDNAIQTPWA